MASSPKKIKSDIVSVLTKSRRDRGSEVVFNEKRVKILNEGRLQKMKDCRGGGVIYWMSRDQRVQDNWALIYAQKWADENKLPLQVVFCLVPEFLGATLRQYDFMLQGLKETENECRSLQIGFNLLLGEAKSVLPDFVKRSEVGFVVTDLSPLRLTKKWVEEVGKKLPEDCCFHQVDAHNVIPVWETSDKQEYAARTIRPRIYRKLDEFLTEFPEVTKHKYTSSKNQDETVKWDEVFESLRVDNDVGPVEKFKPGAKAGLKNLEEFVQKKIKTYSAQRNDPSDDGVSNMSPWTHFGQVSAQRVILYTKENAKGEGVDAFVEECLVRRELSDNFCYYQDNYDNIQGCADWARKSILAHKKDKRPYLYTKNELEKAKTHDDLWNAAQLQMVKEGKMHGFLRMYWAKKIMEWTESPEKALEIAIYMNNRYELDGRDPSGYVGCMWSICGVHDRAWAERAVFGKIRYMNYEGCKRKFDIQRFVSKYDGKCRDKKKL